MEAKKISFGFSKINRKPSFLPTKNIKPEVKVELIKCLEDHEIKLVKEKPGEQLLIIPLKESHKTSAALASLIKRRAVLLDEEESEDINDHSKDSSISISNQDAEEDIEKRAARELLAEVRKENSSTPANNLVVPVVKPEDLPLEGAKEPTLNDYDTIPIQEFGKAMLRGMGWTEPLPNANKKSGTSKDTTPMIRPKGMGLGADKALSKKPLLVDPEENEQLEVKRNAFVIILGGKYKSRYGQIEGFDDHAGRVIVKMAIGGAKEVFNEFLCQPVSRKEYAEYGKRINTIEYEEYKKNVNLYGEVSLDKDKEIFINKNKEKGHYSIEGKYKKFYDDRRKEDYREDKKNFKRDCNEHREQRHDHINIKNENKNAKSISLSKKETTKYEYRDGRRESNRDHIKHQRKQYDGRDEKEKQRDNENYSQRENERLRNNYTKDYKESKTKCCDNSSNRDGDKQREKGISIDCSDKSKCEATELDDSKDSEKYSYFSKHKKSTKKKSKNKTRSKKSKARYKNLSDAEISSMESSSDSDEEKKYRRSRKKSKKSRRGSRSRSKERRM